MTLNIAILGYGTIGKAIEQLINDKGNAVDWLVRCYDTNNVQGAKVYSLDDINDIVQFYDVIIAATPYTVNKLIFSACDRFGKVYIDLTEDVGVRKYIQANINNCLAFPACGLAPGTVSIIGEHMVGLFEDPIKLHIRVGALPLTVTNHLKYDLSWSAEGLVNEYNNPCDVIEKGKLTTRKPLDDVETLVIDGMEYEAFNTSGGIGSLCEHLEDTIDEVNYKTVRYKGHRDLIEFLMDDLGFATKQNELVQLLKDNLPFGTNNDVVLIVAKAEGLNKNVYETRSFVTKVYGDSDMSAIKKTTAAGVCAVVDYYARFNFQSLTPKLPKVGFIGNEQIAWEDFTSSCFSKVYLENAKY